MSSFVSYAQNFEDVMLWRALGHIERGFYVDCGACDPTEHSVTKAFYDRGWRGINIEPVPAFAQRLKEQRPDDVNLAVAVAEHAGVVTVHEFAATGLSTMIGDIAEDHVRAGFEARTIQVPALTLADILRDATAPEIHFLKIDVEGAEYAALAGAALETYRPWVVIVESTMPLQGDKLSHAEWEPLLAGRGYDFVYFDGLNRFYVAAEHSELKPAFASPPNVFDGFIQIAAFDAMRERDVTARLLLEEQAALETHVRQLAESRANCETQARLLEEARINSETQTRLLEESQANSAAQARLLEESRDRGEAQGAELASYKSHVHSLQARIEETLKECGDLRCSAEHWMAAFSETSAELERAKARLEALLRSRSWRVTAPIRKMTTAARIARHEPGRFLPLLAQNVGPARDLGASMDATTRPSLAPVVEMLSAGDRYAAWIAQHEPLDAAFAPGDRNALPTISILVIVRSGTASRLDATIESLRDQSSGNWELVVGGITPIGSLRALADARVTLVPNDAATRGEALRAATDLATGDFVMTLEPGDLLPPKAIATLAHHLGQDGLIDILYADEDVMDDHRRTAPQFKPEWSPELLMAYNYFGRPALVRRASLVAAGSFAADLDEACEWDLHLRLAGAFMHLVSTPHVRRLPMVLCHRHRDAPNGRPAPEAPASAAFRTALARHWSRQGIDASVTTQPDGTQHATWAIADPPLVSIIIPNKNQSGLLRACLEGLRTKTDYKRTEVIVVDNDSTEPELDALYREAKQAGVRIVYFEDTFNYSRACNLGAAAAQGDLLLFLNNDIEVVEPGWLDELVRQSLRPGVGVVGAKLLYPNGALQHAGVVVGCGLVFHKAPEYDWGPLGSPSVTRNWLGVMGACQMIRRGVFQLIHGFDEGCQIATSDVRLSLDAWRAGFRTVYAPIAKLVHHEGMSRGHENPEHDIARTASAIRALGIDDDPYFHPGLSATTPVPTLRLGTDLSTQESLKAEADRRSGPPVAEAAVDLYDDSAVALAAARPRKVILWEPAPPETIHDASSAARFVLDLLRRRRDLRERFPRALSDGVHGTFAEWLSYGGCDDFGLSHGWVAALDEAFRADMAAQARRALLSDGVLGTESPLLLLPPDRGTLVRSLFDAVTAGHLTCESAWWMLMENAEDPAREVIRTWSLTPSWQKRFPDGITRFGRQHFALWVRRTFSLNAAWLDASHWPEVLSEGEEVRLAYLARGEWSRRFPQALSDPAEARVFLAFLETSESGLSPSLRNWCASRDMERLTRQLVGLGSLAGPLMGETPATASEAA